MFWKSESSGPVKPMALPKSLQAQPACAGKQNCAPFLAKHSFRHPSGAFFRLSKRTSACPKSSCCSSSSEACPVLVGSGFGGIQLPGGSGRAHCCCGKLSGLGRGVFTLQALRIMVRRGAITIPLFHTGNIVSIVMIVVLCRNLGSLWERVELWCRNTVGHFFPGLRHVCPDDDEGVDGLEVEDIQNRDPLDEVGKEEQASFVDFFHAEVKPEADSGREVEDIQNEVIIADEGREDIEGVVAGGDEDEEERNSNPHFLFLLSRRRFLLLLGLRRALFSCGGGLRRSTRGRWCFRWRGHWHLIIVAFF